MPTHLPARWALRVFLGASLGAAAACGVQAAQTQQPPPTPASPTATKAAAPAASKPASSAAAASSTANAASPNLAPIAWSDAQAQAAGVRTQVVTADATGAAAGMVLQGTVELPPQAVEVLSAPLAGVVQRVFVGAGQQVPAGAPVAQLLSPELVAWQRELLQAQEQERLAASRLARDEKLHSEGIIAGLRLEDSRAQHRLAQLNLQERQQALRLAGAAPAGGQLQPALAVRATAAGTVLEVLAAPGQRLEAGMPVAKLARSGQWAIRLQATPAQAQSLQVGDLLRVPGCKAPARLAAIVPQVDAGNQMVQLRADFNAKEDCLRANQFVQATVLAGATPSGASQAVSTGALLALPAEAVVRNQGRAYVFVKTPKGFVPTPIEVASESGAKVQVRAGLRSGAEVAVRGLAALKGAWLGMGAEE
ncbi:efflux RND transporter periplasmic adaptor subunit [Extensimonas sp. H3M7-6]|uniref:efflux RND transporter periplasmic adaptor subunit n=1 Tax=Extensimonas soli TaxID=3031322 RepID=UPI0023DC924E|nr:efflux RND transporter periplasmic adaptor subunit [Extensimonas sp. H3M7-6]MDF1483344.1 efflux RND transporter periplasmic adaptor subunit [Extensimonas sp. H3M7-6]